MQNTLPKPAIVPDDTPRKRSSSQKIDMLYVQFQNLKARIHKSTQRKKENPMPSSSITLGQLPKDSNPYLLRGNRYRSNLFIEDCNPTLQPSQMHLKGKEATQKTTQKPAPSPQLVLGQFLQTILGSFLQFQAQVRQKLQNQQRKLKQYEDKIGRIGKLLSMNSSSKTQSMLITQNDQESICAVIMGYQRRIALLIDEYEKKIEIAQENKDNTTYSSSIREKQSNSYEKEILVKQTEINKLRLNYHHLKREHIHLIDKYDQLTQTKARTYSKDQAVQVELKKVDAVCAAQPLPTSSQGLPRSQSLPPLNQERQANEQFYNELGEIEADSNILNEFYTKSQIIQPRRKKEIINHLKSLSLQVNLISEENKHLQSKKHMLEGMAKNSELDEERFQEQSSILKEQIKRLNVSISTFDLAMCQYLKSGRIEKEKIEELPKELKSKQILKELYAKKK